MLPNHFIKDKLTDLINRTLFGRIPNICLAMKNVFFTSDVYKNYNLWTCQKICDALVYLLDNIFRDLDLNFLGKLLVFRWELIVFLLLQICFFFRRLRWLSWMRRPTGDQEVAGSTPAEVGNILSWRLIMKYFLRSFSPFRWFKKGSCQFLAKECAQYWLTA